MPRTIRTKSSKSRPRLKSEKNSKVKACSVLGWIASVANILLLLRAYDFSVADFSTTEATGAAIRKLKSFETPQPITFTADKKTNHRLFNLEISAHEAWNILLAEGAEIMKNKTTPLAAIEVGMHRPIQCIRAAESNFEAHCIEPSPNSFKICESRVRSKNQDVKDKIHLYNVAASSISGLQVDFISGGSTGDSVGGGGNDMWLMTKTNNTQNTANASKQNMVKVKTSKLDDLISENISPSTEVFVAKIDVQGFEPYVFEGLSESIQQNRIMFILFEYWPKGMDFIMDEDFGGDGICKASVKILENLVNAGYKLFALDHEVHPHSFSHPRSKQPNHRSYKKLNSVRNDRPLDDLMENCMWYYKLEREIFPQEDYFFGFWSDIIAMSPKARLEQPSTKIGKQMMLA